MPQRRYIDEIDNIRRFRREEEIPGISGPGPAVAPGLPITIPRPTGAAAPVGVTGGPRMEFSPAKNIEYVLGKLEQTVPNCDPSVAEWVMAAVRNNEKALYANEITNDRYLTNQQKISSYVVDFGHCNCSKASRIR